MDKRWLDAISAEAPRSLKVRVAGRSMLPTFRAGDSAIVEPVAVGDLRVGDFIFFRYGDTGFLHRYIGKRDGHVITKGDAHYWIDTPVAFDDVLGRVSTVHRGTKLIYDRTRCQFWHRITGLVHTMIGRTSTRLRRMKRWFVSFMLMLLMLSVAAGVSASVGLIDFYPEAGENEISLFWETASETGTLGFYIQRSKSEGSGFEDIQVDYYDYDEDDYITSGFIPAIGDAGSYEAIDLAVTVGVTYYYLLQELDENGSRLDLEIVSAKIEPPPTSTPTPTNTPTPTLTPLPNVLFWADPETVAAGDCTTVQWQASNIKSLYFDGAPVGGFGAQAFCPCEDQTHTLVVYYNDGTSAERAIDISVTGYCSDSPSAVATATQPPSSTQTPRPTSTPDAGIDSDTTPTRMIPPTPTATARPTLSPDGENPTQSPTATPKSAQPAVTITPSSEPDSVDRIVIGTPEEETSSITPAMWIGFGILTGIVFVGGGIWLWRQNR